MNPSPSYWDDAAADAQFTHPVKESWISAYGNTAGQVLDFGCGYGRMLTVLQKLGFSRLFGVDPSAEMISRAKTELPDATFATIEGADTGFPDDSFEIVMLVAVLTCVPDSDEQHAIISEITRILSPGGYVYVSDYLLQTDERNLKRYRRFREMGHPHGVFEIDDGRTTMRHHDRVYLDGLLGDLDLVEEREFQLQTMKGNPATGTQLLLRK